MTERYECNLSIFSNVPNFIFGYWLSSNLIGHFSRDKKLRDVGEARQGLGTSDNKTFLRFWYEVPYKCISFGNYSCSDARKTNFKWFPFNKAGYFRKWSPINEYVVNYQNDGVDIKKAVMTKYPYLKTPDFVVKNTDFYFRKGITWNDVSTSKFCARLVDDGFIFADSAPMFFCNDLNYTLAFFNSIVFQKLADFICQGLHYSTGHIPEIPFVFYSTEIKQRISCLVETQMYISKQDVDSFETSWNFKKHPLI